MPRKGLIQAIQDCVEPLLGFPPRAELEWIRERIEEAVNRYDGVRRKCTEHHDRVAVAIGNLCDDCLDRQRLYDAAVDELMRTIDESREVPMRVMAAAALLRRVMLSGVPDFDVDDDQRGGVTTPNPRACA